jgi:hypothetical protein
VIEGAVLADDDDDVFDGSASGFFLAGLQQSCEWASETELECGQRDESNAQTVESL